MTSLKSLIQLTLVMSIKFKKGLTPDSIKAYRLVCSEILIVWGYIKNILLSDYKIKEIGASICTST